MTQENIERVQFKELFRRSLDGRLIAKKSLIVNGVPIPVDAALPRDRLTGGIDFYTKELWDVAVVKRDDGTWVIRGFYTE